MTRCQVALGTRLMSPQPGLARPVQHAQPILCERAATEASRRQGVASHSTWSSGLPLKKKKGVFSTTNCSTTQVQRHCIHGGTRPQAPLRSSLNIQDSKLRDPLRNAYRLAMRYEVHRNAENRSTVRCTHRRSDHGNTSRVQPRRKKRSECKNRRNEAEETKLRPLREKSTGRIEFAAVGLPNSI